MEIVTDKTVVEARFYISEIKLVPFSEYEYDENNKIKSTNQVMGGTVTMNAAKHGTFGKYTPFGSCTMGIQNSHAFNIFKEAYERILKENGHTPRFKVYFVEDDDQTVEK